MEIIAVEGLNFEYEGKRVLHDISFMIGAGHITALVGPNGAGKTTLMRALTGLETPLSGRIVIDGLDVAEHPREIHRRMGYLSDFFGLYDRLSVRRCLTYMAWCHNIPAKDVKARVEEVAKLVGITDYLDKRAGTLSRGYRQRAGIALALIHKPKILLLDEPASGLDPEARVELSRLIHKLQAEGMTLIVSSHILAELEDYCTAMLVIREGRISEHVRLVDHQDRADTHITITLTRPDPAAATLVAGWPGMRDVTAADRIITGRHAGNDAERQALLAHLVNNGMPVCGFASERQSLQAAYMDIAARHGEGNAS